MIIYIGFAITIITAIYLWIKLKDSDQKNQEYTVRISKLINDMQSLTKEKSKAKLSEKLAWETLDKERNQLLAAHNKLQAEFDAKKIETEHYLEREKENLNCKRSELEREYRRLESNLETNYQVKESLCQAKVNRMKEIVTSQTPFSRVAKMAANFESVIFGEAEKYLRLKHPPAPSAKEVVKDMKMKYKDAIFQFKQMQYKYQYLLDVFPEVKSYINDEEALLHLSDYNDIKEFSDERDRSYDWLSNEEYQALSIDERNQLALDRYKQRHKTNWEVGMEYEMYIGYLLRRAKFYVIQFGIENGLSDLGRDIIAEKAHLDGSRTIYIIQCKRWAEDHPLHENVICQLFGTKIDYGIKHRHYINTKIVPVLVTTGNLSDTAKEFAKRLDVVIKKVEMGEYPMIKCNINGDEKIYHLPFDQQYYTTKIDENQGERYAWTVEEAVSNGFRRAMRWKGNN